MFFDLRTLKLAAALAVIPVAIAIYATTAAKHRAWNADEVPIAFWAWKTAVPSSEEASKSGAQTIFLRAGQMDLVNGEVKRIRPAKGSLPEGVELHLVYNGTRDLLRGLESIGPEALARAIAETYAEDRSGSANVKGIQLDLDFPTRLLLLYQRTVTALRPLLPADSRLSITGLPTWMSSREIEPLLESVDFWAPQLYGAEIPTNLDRPIPISSAKQVRRATIAARQLGKPFYAGLAAYGYAIQYDTNGDLVELRGDIDASMVSVDAAFELVSQKQIGSSYTAGDIRKVFRAKRDVVLEVLVLRTGESLVFDSPTPESLREAARIVREEGGEALIGICVFRLPSLDDKTNLRLAEIVDSLRDRPAINGVELRATRSDESIELTVENTGSTSSFAREALSVDISVPPGTVRGVLRNNGFAGFETLCAGAPVTPSKCSPMRANLIRLTKNSWRPGDEASVRLRITSLPSAQLTAHVETRSDTGRVERIQKTIDLEETHDEN
jgi:hypothetical protein